MASSGPKENVIFTTTILMPQMTTKLCVKGDMVLKGLAPQGRTILIRNVDVNSVLPTYGRRGWWCTSTDQYLYWNTDHNLSVKYIFNNLTGRARTVCSHQELLREEEECIRKALHMCKYSTWALNRLQTNISLVNS